MNQETLMMRINVREETWLKDCEKAFQLAIDDFKTLMSMSKAIRDPYQALREYHAIKETYNLLHIPSKVLESIFGIMMEGIDGAKIDVRNGDVSITYKQILIWVDFYRNDISVRDISEKHHVERFEPLTQSERIIVDFYELYRNKELTRLQFGINSANELISIRKKRKTLFHKLYLIKEGYEAAERQADNLNELVLRKEAEIRWRKEQREALVKNNERDRLKEETLQESGLKAILDRCEAETDFKVSYV